MSAQPARLIPLPHRGPHRPTAGASLELFVLEDVPSVPAVPAQSMAAEALLAEALEAYKKTLETMTPVDLSPFRLKPSEPK